MKFKIAFSCVLLALLFSCSDESKNYDNVISELKKQELTFDKLEKYQIIDFSNTSTIRKLDDDYTKERGKGKGLIWVYKTKENLLIFIETKDDGHAGEYGVVYSESGQIPTWNNDEWGEFWSIGEKIDGNWWKIYFDLG